MERCEGCGFAWAEVDREEIAGRVDAGTADVAALIVVDPERSAVRPSPERWSATQYAAHMRDVLNTIRDRLVIGLVEDNPTFNAMSRDERVNLGLYDGDPAGATWPSARSARSSAPSPCLRRLPNTASAASSRMGRQSASQDSSE